MKIKIYVMAHKKFQQKLPQEYIPLQVGAVLGQDLGYLKDNEGENISHKNRNFCELTGLYWVWKNSDADVVGLCHYRRYLSNWPLDRKLKHILSGYDIEKRLKRCDIILPYPVLGKRTNRELYCSNHYDRDYKLTRQAIQTVSPEYVAAFDSVMEQRSCCQCNMFISSKRVADAYCQWLFRVYEELEKHADIRGYDPYQARMYGFMSERLLNVWVTHNKLKRSYAFFASTEVNYGKALWDKCKQFLN